MFAMSALCGSIFSLWKWDWSSFSGIPNQQIFVFDSLKLVNSRTLSGKRCYKLSNTSEWQYGRKEQKYLVELGIRKIIIR